MQLLEICAFILFATCFILWGFFYRATEKAKRLEAERLDLKGEICRLKSELATQVYTSNKVMLTLPEKRIILNALESLSYKERVREPQTKKFIRIIYNTLRKKIKESIKE